MPDHTNTRCTVSGCDAWAMDGDGHCAMHAPAPPDPLGPHIETVNPDGSVTRTEPEPLPEIEIEEHPPE